MHEYIHDCQACFIVPPHLLSAIADGEDEEASQLAHQTLEETRQIHTERHQFFEAKRAHRRHHRGRGMPPGYETHNSIVPDHLLEHIRNSEHVDEPTRRSASITLTSNRQLRDTRATDLAQLSSDASALKLPPSMSSVSTTAVFPNDQTNTQAAPAPGTDTTIVHRGIYDMQSQSQTNDLGQDTISQLLPGTLVRSEGDPPSTTDEKVNEAYSNCGLVIVFYRDVFSYNSLDSQGMPILSSVHYKQHWQNAAWLGGRIRQMVYGDGGGSLYNFTACLDVIGHEMTHAITEYNSSLAYQDESGALNEHISDAFGIMVKQYSLKQTTEESDWLIGEGCLMPDVKGVALRSMKMPGTAYNDSGKLGKDPQPPDYDSLQTMRSSPQFSTMLTRDHGGVHIFSGVPNRAFYLVATAFGGYSWAKAGRIWWETVTGDVISPNCTFVQFADATVDSAGRLFGREAAGKVRGAWDEVGVKRDV